MGVNVIKKKKIDILFNNDFFKEPLLSVVFNNDSLKEPSLNECAAFLCSLVLF
jgi:hypothetical protein